MKEEYVEFAEVYAAGSYPSYSRYMAERLPDILGELGCRASSILDLACGEGTFGLEAAELGFEVVGVDKSSEMVKIARDKAEERDLDVRFLQGDMRNLGLDERFGLVTSWFDSMNYLLTEYDLREALRSAHHLLEDGGCFVFDVNTVHGLSEEWQQEKSYVQRDDSDLFEVHRTDYHPSRRIAELRITFFRREGECWKKGEEVHEERAYELARLKELAREVGFQVDGVWDDLEDFSSPEEDSGRVWFALRKG